MNPKQAICNFVNISSNICNVQNIMTNKPGACDDTYQQKIEAIEVPKK